LSISLVVLLGAASARAQAPAPPPEPAEISACLCLQQAVAALSAEMNQKTQALDAVTRQLAELDAQLAQSRANLNINDANAVARYKALLERRDAAYRQSIGPVHADATQATARYNERVNEYNARCANRPFNSALVAEIQAHLSCPPTR
jgi:multidrug resistance efflux pump